MKKDKILNINNFCDSCRHIMEEKGEDLSKYDSTPLKKRTYCYGCGQHLNDNSFGKDIDLVMSALENKNLKVVCYTAPSVRVSLGDEFGFKAGEFVQGKMISALRKIGFYAVFDMNCSADFTILEEAHEFVKRLEKNENLPMFTSCCPGWVNYATKVYPSYAKNLSTTKSPQQIFGALLNNFYAQKIGVTPPDIFVVSIVPCLAKKLELRQNKDTTVGLDVDVALTTKELATMIRHKQIDFQNLEDGKFDDFFGSASGAGAIFGNTGGVMEAVLRTLNDTLSKKEQAKIDYEMVRGLDSIRRAKIKLGSKTISIAVVTGLKNVPIIMEELEKNPKKYQFIEVMACEGGCVGGGGQPNVILQSRNQVLQARAEGLYNGEKNLLERKAHKNEAILKFYETYLGEVGGAKAERLLHRDFDLAVEE